MKNSEEIWQIVEDIKQEFIELSDKIWGMPELNYKEFRSAEEYRTRLTDLGFRVTDNIAGIPTAMIGEAGDEGPVIAILGEFDALPGLSQQAGVAHREPITEDGPGHGCGHNVFGAASLLAASAIKDYLKVNGLKGRVRFYACPAEEGGAAKGFMVRAGAFSDVDAVITWHPGPFSGINRATSLACVLMEFYFKGRSTHAASTPHLGRSALDAVELMNVGVNYMREHMPSDARVHYAVIDTGGRAPNVVQEKATVRYLVRAKNLAELHPLVERVRKIADGAALMTETSVTNRVLSASANMDSSSTLQKVMHENFLRLGPPQFSDEDKAFATEIQKTLMPTEVASAFKRYGALPTEESLCDAIIPMDTPLGGMIGSADTGTVSWVVPLVQARGATYAIGTAAHTWQITAQGKTPAAHKGLEHIAKVMAATAVDLFTDTEILDRAKQEHNAKRAAQPFVDPIPEGVNPPLEMSESL